MLVDNPIRKTLTSLTKTLTSLTLDVVINYRVEKLLNFEPFGETLLVILCFHGSMLGKN